MNKTELKTEDIVVSIIRVSASSHALPDKNGVRITHIPSGVYAESRCERSTHANKAKAMELLKALLNVRETEKKSDPEMLSRRNHLLACIGEEAGEIQQAVGKALRFGLFDTNPATRVTNWLELKGEIHDLIAVYQLFCDEIDRSEMFDLSLTSKKKSKVIKMMGYARDQGALSE